jgi:FixJ family two-component response regulator
MKTQSLNVREIAVLRESARGLVAKEIGPRLGMSRRTVDFYRWMRHRNIAARDWPPPHLDADGDFKPDPEEKEAE